MKLLNYSKALADETRIRLLNLLMERELNVNEIVSVMGMGQSRISRHLKILSDTGLLTHRRDGLWVFYRAAMNGRERRFIDSIREFLKGDDCLNEDRARLERLITEGAREKTRFFDSIAADWDRIRYEILGDLDISREIISRIGPCGTAVDLGCGTGELLTRMSDRAELVIGVDKSPGMLEETRGRTGEMGGRADLRLGEIEHLPMRDGEADYCVMNMVLHHLPSPREALEETGRVTAAGGRLVLADLERHTVEEMRHRYGHRWLGFDRDDIEKWLKGAGFSVLETAVYPVKKGLTVNLTVAEKRG